MPQGVPVASSTHPHGSVNLFLGLPQSLEMRLCHGQFPNDEDVIISLVEIFVM